MQTSFQPIANFGSRKLLLRLQGMLSSDKPLPAISQQDKTQLNFLTTTNSYPLITEHLNQQQLEKLYLLRKSDFKGPQQFLTAQETYLGSLDVNGIIQLQNQLNK
jgi:hypothetical protein